MAATTTTWVLAAALLALQALGDLNRLLPVNSGTPPTSHDPKYKIEFHDAQEPYIPEDPDTEMVRMTGADGERFECFLPRKPQTSSKETGMELTESLRKTPEELLNVLEDRCFHRHEGWWTYELCYHGAFRQMHFEASKDKRQGFQEFVLGVYDAEATARLHASTPVLVQKDPLSQHAAQKYFAHMYVNGTKCDLTGSPRETEVRFVCADSGMLVISSIKESPSCKYTVILQAPMLCQHPLFAAEHQTWLEVNCNTVSGTNDVYEIGPNAKPGVSQHRGENGMAVPDEVRSAEILPFPRSIDES